MQEKPFLDLINEDNLKRLQIDPRLLPAFKNVMTKLQSFFDANNYTNAKDYKKYFEDYLLLPKESNEVKYDPIGYRKNGVYHYGFIIGMNNEPSKIGASGFYNKKTNRICIDEKCLNSNLLEHVLLHEIIHFLVMHDLEKGYADTQILNGGFINEALTEMLTHQIYTNNLVYIPQVKMLEFANIISNNSNNYKYFLIGKIDSKISSANWKNFVENANTYQNSVNQSFDFNEAKTNQYYINAQRELVKLYAKVPDSLDVNEYLSLYNNIMLNAPVMDNNYIEEKYDNLDKLFVSKLLMNNPILVNTLANNLKRLRQINLELKQIDQDIYEFVFDNKVLNLTKDYQIICQEPLFGTSVQSDPTNNKILLRNSKTSERLEIDTSKIDFTKKRRDLLKEKDLIITYFDKSNMKDIEAVNSLIKMNVNLESLEKFELPNINLNKKNSDIIYVAKADGKTILLNNQTFVKDVANVNLAKYQGITSKEDGLIMYESIRPMEGKLFSVLNATQIENSIKRKLFNNNCKSGNMDEMIEYYKNSPDYNNEVGKDLNDMAAFHFTEQQYNHLPETIKTKEKEEVINNNNRFIVTKTNNNIEIASTFNDKLAFKAKSTPLINANQLGLYNDLYRELKQNNLEQSSKTL